MQNPTGKHLEVACLFQTKLSLLAHFLPQLRIWITQELTWKAAFGLLPSQKQLESLDTILVLRQDYQKASTRSGWGVISFRVEVNSYVHAEESLPV